MRVKLTTTITTYIDIGNNTVEEARREIFDRYHELSQDLADEGISRQASCVLMDEIIGTEVSHSFGDADE